MARQEGDGSRAAADEAPTKRQRPPEPRWLQLVRKPGFVATAVVTTIAAYSATQVATEVHSRIQLERPLAVSIETDPGRIAGMGDAGFLKIISVSVRTAGSPGEGCGGFYAWHRTHGAVDADESRLQVIAQGKVSGAVLISGLRVRVIKRAAPLKGIPVVCPTAGEARSVRCP